MQRQNVTLFRLIRQIMMMVKVIKDEEKRLGAKKLHWKEVFLIRCLVCSLNCIGPVSCHFHYSHAQTLAYGFFLIFFFAPSISFLFFCLPCFLSRCTYPNGSVYILCAIGCRLHVYFRARLPGFDRRLHLSDSLRMGVHLSARYRLHCWTCR